MTQDFAFAPTSKIFVRNLILRANIGALSHERHGEQDVRFTVEMTVPTITDHQDQLEKVVPYHIIVRRIKEIIAHGHIELVESLSQRIIAAAFEEPRILACSVTIEKLDVIPGAESAGITTSAVRISTSD
jgi:7,8-dihydroneopterin aldolase/epimerase/oxygenase